MPRALQVSTSRCKRERVRSDMDLRRETKTRTLPREVLTCAPNRHR